MSLQPREVVRRIPQQPGHRATAGLRIAATGPDHARLSVRAVMMPRRGDTVVERDGARVFLDAAARQRLRGRLLHVVTLRDGRLQFRTRPRDDAA